MIRDREFVEQTGRLPSNGDTPMAVASEQLNDDLYVMYVADSEHSVRYLSEEDLAAVEVDRANLRRHAMENLRRLYPEVQMMGAEGLYMFRLDGTYESSLLLSEHLWDRPEMKVKGEFLVAVPSRDVLVISGTLEREPLEAMRKIVADVSTTAAYRDQSPPVYPARRAIRGLGVSNSPTYISSCFRCRLRLIKVPDFALSRCLVVTHPI